MNQKQVKLYMSYRKQSNQTQLTAANAKQVFLNLPQGYYNGEHQTKRQPKNDLTSKGSFHDL